jgi:hypothetical protein
MKLTKETAFVGAKVKYQLKEYEIVKVNVKTVYITQDKELTKKIRLKLKGLKTLDLIKSSSLMIDMSDIEIDDKELARKDEAVKVAELKKKQKRVLGVLGQKKLDELIARIYNPKNKYSWKNVCEVGKNEFIQILVANKEKKIILLSVNDSYYFYDITQDLYIPYNPKIHKKGYGDINIVWPEVTV